MRTRRKPDGGVLAKAADAIENAIAGKEQPTAPEPDTPVEPAPSFVVEDEAGPTSGLEIFEVESTEGPAPPTSSALNEHRKLSKFSKG